MESKSDYQIPKIIHYFWLGKNPKPESVLKCIESWKRNCPDFEIKEWNEENYDVHKHPYMERAYSEKRWAFVPDYGRLDIMYQYGGIYLDTDVEVLKDLSPLCKCRAFKGFENSEYVNDGQGFGCVPGMPIFREMMACYDGDEPYEIVDGKQLYIESPRLCTRVLLRHGLVQNGKKQVVEGIDIFPSDYFCPLSYDTGRIKITENTYSIHHFDASWHGKNAAKHKKIRQSLNRFFGVKIGMKMYLGVIKVWRSLKGIAGRHD